VGINDLEVLTVLVAVCYTHEVAVGDILAIVLRELIVSRQIGDEL